MTYRPQQRVKVRETARRNAVVAARSGRVHVPIGKRAGASEQRRRGSVLPPEQWHEPRSEPRQEFSIIVQPPGAGYQHVLTPDEIRTRLRMLPAWMTRKLEVVQLSTMTRKKRTYPCYGMQWGNSIYLYPVEDSYVETIRRPPDPAQQIEARMFGVDWRQSGRRTWELKWTPESIRDFYLNNILIHELGHLLDDRNSSYADRERYAEWFAIEHGYRPTRASRI